MHSERTSNWTPLVPEEPKLPSTRKTPDFGPISTAPTMKATPQSHPESPPYQPPQPEPPEKKARLSPPVFIAATIAGLIAVAGGAYAGKDYLNQEGLFAPESQTTTKTSAQIESNEKPPEKLSIKQTLANIKTDKELNKALESLGLRVTDYNFEFSTKGNFDLHAKAVMFKLEDENQGRWVPLKDKITETDMPTVLVAIQIRNPYLEKDPKTINVSGAMNKARSQAIDRIDDDIMYLVLNAEDKKTGALTQVGIRNPSKKPDPSNPNAAMWFRSFRFPYKQRE